MTSLDRAHDNSLLGRAVDYPRHYDASLLFPIARSVDRSALALETAMPFIGYDRWHAYELSWLDVRGKPGVATAPFIVPADSPHLVESKLLKMYLNSFNATRFYDAEAVRARIAGDLSQAAGAPVMVRFGVPPLAEEDDASVNSFLLDTLDITIDDYGPPNATHLHCMAGRATETLCS